MDSEELNEVATLLHVTSEIAQNHPNLQGIGRACQRRLAEINGDLVKAELEEARALKQDQAERQARDYKVPTPNHPDYVPLEDNADVVVERRV